MWPYSFWIAGVILTALTIYALTGGADFGGGVWDMLALGPRAKAQRELIADAIAPIWEANHVWLIVVIVLLFVCFPVAFAAVMTALHIPLVILLVGIVLRGSAFTFRAYGIQSKQAHAAWGQVFAIASVFTPIFLGVTLGGVASDKIRVDPATGIPQVDFFSAWLAPFPFALGLLVLSLFAFLAAVYLAVEAETPALQDDFRRRGLAAGVLVGVFAWVCFYFAGTGAPELWKGLGGEWWSLPFQVVTGGVAVAAMAALWWGRFALARILAGLQVTLMIWGWGFAQYPYIVPPDLTLTNSAGPDSVLGPVLIALIAGLILVIPAFAFLYSLFKGRGKTAAHGASS